MGRFDNIIPTPQTGVNKFDNITTTGGRFDNLVPTIEKKPSFLSRTLKSFGGLIGKVGHALNIGQYAQMGATTELLEKTGVLKETPKTIKGAFKAEASNIELLKRIGSETGGGGLLTDRKSVV